MSMTRDESQEHAHHHDHMRDGHEHAGHEMHAEHQMHAGHDMHGAMPKAPLEPCVMRGTCKGPMSAVVALLSNQGVPPLDSFTIAPASGVTLTAGPAGEHVSSRLASPDPPPPRA